MMLASLLLNVTVVMALGLAGARIMRRSRAAVRHVVLAASFAMLLVLPVASIAPPSVRVAVPEAVQQVIDPLVNDAVVDTPAANAVADAPVQAAEKAPFALPSLLWFVTTAWIAGAVTFLLPVFVGLRQVRALRRSALPWRDGSAVVDRLAADAGIRRRVDLLVHESLPGPMTCGVFRPAIVLPIDAKTWSGEDLNRAIVHELEHVRRGDWVSHCLSRIIAAGYWFHPIVWAAWRQLSLEAERACDDAVIQRSEATAYADQLVELAQKLSVDRGALHHPQLAMANRADLAMRVSAVLDAHQRRGRVGLRFVGVAVVAALIVTISMSSIRIVSAAGLLASSYSTQAAAQEMKAKYDAAIVKPCVAEESPTGARGTAGGTNATFSPGRFFVPCVTVEQLIYLAYAAYGVNADEHLVNDDLGTASNAVKVRGGPDWVHSLRDKYQIEAMAAGATERTVLMGTMLQSLLEDRFHLKLHRGTEEVALMSLVVGKGFKLKPMKDGDCDPNDGSGPPDPNAAKPRCGNLMMTGSSTLTRWTFNGFDISNLASQLSRTLGVHIVDNTGIKDKFIFVFQFSRSEDAFATEASVQASLDEQLGLKLEKTKGPRGFLAIDNIERPKPDGETVVVPQRASGAGAKTTGLMQSLLALATQTPSETIARFEVVSIKPCAEERQLPGVAPPPPPGARRGGAGGWQAQTTPGRVYWDCATLASLVDLAYADRDHPLLNTIGNAEPTRPNGVGPSRPQRVRGGSSWVENDKFSIEAKVPLDLTAAALAGSTGRNLTVLPSGMASALRALLEDRFQVKVRRESEQQQMYALMVADSGLNKTTVTVPVPGDCVTREQYFALRASAPAAASRSIAEVEAASPRICGQVFSSLSGQEFSSATLAQLAADLSTQMDHFVLDRTGLDAQFNFKLRLGSGDNVDGRLIAGLQALGVRAEWVKAPAEYLLIERAEKPRPDFAFFADSAFAADHASPDRSTGKPRLPR